MFDAYTKDALKKAVVNLSNQADNTVLMHELAAFARALLVEEINKRPDDPKPEEAKPAEEAKSEEAKAEEAKADDEPVKRGARR